MAYAEWMNCIGPDEPDYFDEIIELESMKEMMMDIECYEDYYVDLP